MTPCRTEKVDFSNKKTNIITKTTNRQEESPEKKRTRKKRTKPAFFLSFFFVKPYILCVAGLMSLEARSLRFCHSWKRCRSQQKVGVAALTKQRWVR
jgi:hypothetical protein